MTVERLQKILSNAGVASRRVAEELILSGRVAVNGTIHDTLGARADLEVDEVTVDGVPVVKERYRYFLLNKPAGFITTARDEMDRETVLDLVPIGDIQLHPVGRLDRDSEGLIILTNDGHLTDLLTHPRYEVEKEYLAGLDSMPGQRDLERLVRGIESDGERLRASAVHAATPPAAPMGEEAPGAAYWLDITLKEGRNREIRRMMDALGRQVLLLRRIRLGPLRLGDLGSGAFRELSADEVEALYAAGKRAEALAEARPDSERERFVAPSTPARPAKSAPRRSRPEGERERFVARPKQAGPAKASRSSRFAAGAPRAAASEGVQSPKAAPKQATGRPAGKAGGGQGKPQAPRRRPGGPPKGGR